MKRILSERNLVVALFLFAFVVSVLAEQDAKRIEKTYTNSVVSSAPFTSVSSNPHFAEVKTSKPANQ
jgi:hypothetical protein